MGLWPPRGTHDGPDWVAGTIEVFPTGLTVARADPSDDEHTTAPESVSGDVHRDFHARPGHRPGGQPPVTSARFGGDTDIVRPILVAPVAATRIVLAGDVFELPLPHLRVDTHRFDARFLVWTAMVVAERERPVPATLHLLGSPSMVVTVLELVPSRRLHWGRERFVRHGIEAIDALAVRIEHAA